MAAGEVIAIGRAAEVVLRYLGELNGNDNRMVMSIVNETQEVLHFEGDHVAHGKWVHSPPAQIPPNHTGVFSGRDRENSVWTGFEGLAIYRGGSAFSAFFLANSPELGANKSHAAIAGVGAWNTGRWDEFNDDLTADGGNHDWGGYRIVRASPGEEARFIVRNRLSSSRH